MAAHASLEADKLSNAWKSETSTKDNSHIFCKGCEGLSANQASGVGKSTEISLIPTSDHRHRPNRPDKLKKVVYNLIKFLTGVLLLLSEDGLGVDAQDFSRRQSCIYS